MKKKLLFMIINMNIGGTEKALLSTLQAIDKNKNDVTILMMENYGGFLNDIPDWVTIEYVKKYKNMKFILNNPLHITAINFLKKGRLLKFIYMVYQYIIYKVMREQSSLFKYILKNYKTLDVEYDIAIAYAGPMDFISYFILNKVKSKKKIQWIHFDVTKIGFNINFASKWYSKFDRIFVVSKEGKEKLDSIIPSIKDKTEVFCNIVCRQTIEKMAEKDNVFEDDFDGIRIVTVGRLTREKGHDITIPILDKLIRDGYKIRWYCIGEGNRRTEYEKLIEKYNLKENYILLGAKSNPYPYIKKCDIYVQPSIHEGYCISLAEARCLNKPIVATDFAGANEQLKHGKTGMIVKRNEKEIYESIKRLIDDDSLRQSIIENLKQEIIDTSQEINKLVL